MAISFADWKMICPQLSAKALAYREGLVFARHVAGSGGTDLVHNVSNFFLNLLLGAQKSLPQLIANAATLQQIGQGMLRVPYCYNAVDVLDGAA
jgi:hypothetical protein